MRSILSLTTKVLLSFVVVFSSQADVIRKSKFINGTSTMQSQIEETLLIELKKFQMQNDLQALENAANYVNGLQVGEDKKSTVTTPNFHAQKLKFWVTIFNAMDQKIDPKFDIEKTPELSVAPPEGAQVPAGSDPKSIKDENLRQKYIQSIEQNKEKAKQFNFQYKLLKLNKLITDDAQLYIQEAHLKTAPSKNLYLQTIDQTVEAPQRKAALKNLAM
jgi:hypothetical protein